MLEKIKILFLASNPANTSKLRLDEEIRGIEKRLKESKYRNLIELKSRWAVKADDLILALNEENPEIVHFCGHGSKDGLIFHDGLNGNNTISAKALKKLFTTLNDNIKLIFLNSCYSSEQAKILIDCVDCVIGMNNAIDDKVAIVFAATFYRAIGFGKSIQNAYDQGIVSILFKSENQEHIPQIQTKKGFRAKNLFILRKDSSQSIKETNNIKNKNLLRDVPNKRMNRKFGDKFLKKKLPTIIKHIKYKQKLSILILDIDDLTKINKVYSRKVGNNIIAHICRIIYIESGTENSGRCGDDTFYILLAGENLESSMQIAERIRNTIEKYDWNSLANNLFVTCTFGVAELQKNEPVKDWVVRAIIGMNEGKKEGVILREKEKIRKEIEELERQRKIGWAKQKKEQEEKYKVELEKYEKEFERAQDEKELDRILNLWLFRKNTVNAGPLFLAKNQSRNYNDYYS